jgi:Extracellular link domain
MLNQPTILMIAIAGLVLLAIVTLVSTGSFVSLLVVLALAGLVGYVLNKMGYLTVSEKGGELDIGFHESAPAPASQSLVPPDAKPLEQKEVFYISGNDYTYDDAPAVCAAYDAELATYDQVSDAYSKGAEWCGYGWTMGGMALYPTQDATWQKLQTEVDESKRTACGRPGVNGGYFDPQNKFGVNCYGIKPSSRGPMKFPLPVPGEDSKAFDSAVQKFKNMIGKMVVSPFNRDGWSEWAIGSHMGDTGAKLAADIKKKM